MARNEKKTAQIAVAVSIRLTVIPDVASAETPVGNISHAFAIENTG